VKFKDNMSNPLEVKISQTYEFGKAIRPLFTDPVTYCIEIIIVLHAYVFLSVNEDESLLLLPYANDRREQNKLIDPARVEPL